MLKCFKKGACNNLAHTEDLRTVYERAVANYNIIIAGVQDERELCLMDRRFCTVKGAQWEGDLAEQFANRPKFEVNKIHLSVMRIFNEYRNNRIRFKRF